MSVVSVQFTCNSHAMYYMKCYMQTTILKPNKSQSQVKPTAKSQVKPKPKANKSQQKPTKANKSQQKPTKANKSQRPKAKGQKPSGHANGKFWLQNAANSKENCPRLKNKNILSIYICIYYIYNILQKQTNKQTNCVATMHPKSYCQPFTTSHFVETKS